MIEVIPKSKSIEDFEKAFSKFKKLVNNSGVVKEVNERRYFITKSEKRRQKEKRGKYNSLNERQ